MRLSFTELVAVATLVLWPVIPLFWIPVHCLPKFFRRLGYLTYVLPFIIWLPVALFMFELRDILLSYRISLPLVARIVGALLFVLGVCLQAWTLSLLTLPGIMGMPEVTRAMPGRLMTTGPFTVIRHPTYLSHTMMLLGLFLWTAVTTLGVLTLIDVFVVNAMVIPLEERELLERFGTEYEEYRRKVPSRFFPCIHRDKTIRT